MQRANYKNNTKTKKKEHPDLSPEEIKHLTGIFSDKGWSLENDDNAFNNFCETLKFLEPEERKLIL
ncbi:MAG: hypothetical protein K2N49_00500, partial [Ruminococcus sp.]|nr:hypothetical protein [Ruminococcus sp.]